MAKPDSTRKKVSSKTPARRRFIIREIDSSSWPEVEEALGENDACRGCWCSYWRLDDHKEFSQLRGSRAKRRLKEGVQSGTVHGLVAYMLDDPVGWCTFGPRHDFPQLRPANSQGDGDNVWSIPCFYVKPGYRRLGVSSALLAEALRVLKRRKAAIAEGYPILVPQTSSLFPDFTWTGSLTMCLKAGFRIVERGAQGTARVRKTLLETKTESATRKKQRPHR